MTIREEIASRLLAGLLSNQARWKEMAALARNGVNHGDITSKNVNKAVVMADALIERLWQKELPR